jgi:hypothetical protein
VSAYVTEWIREHPATISMALYYLFSSAVGAMPMPDASSGKFYRWLFSFLNTLAANLNRAYRGVNNVSPSA